ncbi:molybdopterin-binding protein [Frigoribacterium sp. CFBP9039]|uniref:MogA/MoaB family molybdenum cofactor biosynthesis protein n=1 Tax=Frigoribacterium sp. CFBP9029 TaxID=3096541 RepID=UPI002A6B1748|nr:molybdenum cofactor synthesis domain-containing protein [Frigoribacterium sp. CFBP9039]MDY0944786.1 molybdopterin-binding protein [Frigoribacterium sp. CFBP9039]
MTTLPVRRAVVIVASTRAAAGRADDLTGPVIREWFEARRYDVPAPVVVADGEAVGRALAEALATSPDVIVTTGGTGVSPTDATPEQTRPLLDRELPGVADELRRRGVAATPTAVLSRGVAGVAGRTFVVNLPGSRGGVRDGLEMLGDIVDHVVDQLDGGSHD